MRPLTVLPPPDIQYNQANAVITRDCPDAETARELYRIVFNRLNTVHEWSRYMKTDSSFFALCNYRGERVMRLPKKGDYLRMDIAGEYGFKGDGYHWFLVREAGSIQPASADEGYFIRIHASGAPDTEKNAVAFVPPGTGAGMLQVRRNGGMVTVKINMPATDDPLSFENGTSWQWRNLAAALMPAGPPRRA